MKMLDACEAAYKNGYNAGYKAGYAEGYAAARRELARDFFGIEEPPKKDDEDEKE